MNHLTVCYRLPNGFDAAKIVHYPLVKRMEWTDAFVERDAWSALAKADGSCGWHWDDPCYASECGHLFEFNNDGPAENSFRFCPFCGKAIA